MTGDLNATFGHRPIYTSRRFRFLCAAPALLTPNSSLLTGEQGFHSQARGGTPERLTLSPKQKRTAFAMRF